MHVHFHAMQIHSTRSVDNTTNRCTLTAILYTHTGRSTKPHPTNTHTHISNSLLRGVISTFFKSYTRTFRHVAFATCKSPVSQNRSHMYRTLANTHTRGCCWWLCHASCIVLAAGCRKTARSYAAVDSCRVLWIWNYHLCLLVQVTVVVLGSSTVTRKMVAVE